LYELVCRRADAVWARGCQSGKKRVALDVGILAGEQPMVQVELIRRSLVCVGSGERDLSEQHYERIIGLVCADGGKTVELPGPFAARRERGVLVFEHLSESDGAVNLAEESMDLTVPGQTRFGRYAVNACVEEIGRGRAGGRMLADDADAKYRQEECFDFDTIQPALRVRHRRPGDRFVPLGMKSEKKVGKFLTAAQVPSDVRDNALIVEDAKKTIWVYPVRMSEECKVTATTARVLRLRIDRCPADSESGACEQ